MQKKHFKSFFSILSNKPRQAVLYLIIINGGVFVLLQAIRLLFANSSLHATNAYNAIRSTIVFNADATHPWALLTYGWVHIELWQILSNMIWLFFFGSCFSILLGNARLWAVYLYGTASAGLCYALCKIVFESFHYPALAGSEMAITCIATCTLTIAPRYKIHSPFLQNGIPLWAIVVVFVLIHIGSSPFVPTLVATLGSALMGYLFAWQLKVGNDWSRWLQKISEGFNTFLYNQHSNRIQKQKARVVSTKPFVKTVRYSQERVDFLLDKINEQGYQQLSASEKDYLISASKIVH